MINKDCLEEKKIPYLFKVRLNLIFMAHFLKEFFHNPRAIGAIKPSSLHLAEVMAAFFSPKEKNDLEKYSPRDGV